MFPFTFDITNKSETQDNIAHQLIHFIIMRLHYLFFAAVIAGTLLSCETGYNPDDYADSGSSSGNSTVDEGTVSVTFNIASIEQVEFENTTYTTRATDIADLCTRVDFASFSESDNKTTYNYTSDDDDFGTLSVNLAEGTNRVVILAHNGTGTASIYRPDSIRFSNNKVTDTFYYYAEIEPTDGETYNVSLTRAVAMFRLIVTDDTPEDVTQMQFYYTGGSSTFDATEGFGIVQSRQTEIRDVESSAYNSQSTYEIYTFPHDTNDEIKVTVTALDASGNELTERVFEDVPVTINTITQYTGSFFTETAESGNATFRLTTSSQWDTETYTY